jgi:hypothetical protein
MREQETNKKMKRKEKIKEFGLLYKEKGMQKIINDHTRLKPRLWLFLVIKKNGKISDLILNQNQEEIIK